MFGKFFVQRRAGKVIRLGATLIGIAPATTSSTITAFSSGTPGTGTATLLN